MAIQSLTPRSMNSIQIRQRRAQGTGTDRGTYRKRKTEIQQKTETGGGRTYNNKIIRERGRERQRDRETDMNC